MFLLLDTITGFYFQICLEPRFRDISGNFRNDLFVMLAKRAHKRPAPLLPRTRDLVKPGEIQVKRLAHLWSTHASHNHMLNGSWDPSKTIYLVVLEHLHDTRVRIAYTSYEDDVVRFEKVTRDWKGLKGKSLLKKHEVLQTGCASALMRSPNAPPAAKRLAAFAEGWLMAAS